MAITTVEMLVKAQEPQNSRGVQRKDIITVQAALHGWGKGDLTGKCVIIMDLDLPYGTDCMKVRRCSSCEYQGIVWKDAELKEGSLGNPKITCPKEKLISIDGDFVFRLNVQGMPYVSTDLKRRRAYNIEYRDYLTQQQQLDIETDAAMISDAEKNARLLYMKGQKILESDIKKKTVVVTP